MNNRRSVYLAALVDVRLPVRDFREVQQLVEPLLKRVWLFFVERFFAYL